MPSRQNEQRKLSDFPGPKPKGRLIDIKYTDSPENESIADLLEIIDKSKIPIKWRTRGPGR